MKKQLIIISVGGSLIAGKKIDFAFLKKFNQTLESFFSSHQFVCIAGGGGVARSYQAALRRLGVKDSLALDHVGISSTVLNAYLLKAAIKGSMYPEVIRQRHRIPKNFEESVVVSSGWTPGQSSDGVAVDIAIALKCVVVINLTNVAGVFPSAPNTRRSLRQPMKVLTWNEYFNIVGTSADSGEHQPFGIIGAKKAHKHHLTVLVLSGKTMRPLQRFLSSGEVCGTMIF